MTTDPGDAGLTHEAPYRVRFDEAGPDGLLRTSGLLRYAQDVAWQHSVALGFGRDWYAERGLTWLVRAAELEVLAEIPMGTTVISQTAVVGMRRVWARRRGEFRLHDGRLAGWVHTDWVMIDRRGALMRIPAIFGERFRIPESDDRMGRVVLPPTPPAASRRSFVVRPHELDPMDHVNNAVYLDWLEESIAAAPSLARSPIADLPRRYHLEYANAADAGTALTDEVWNDDDAVCYRVRRDDAEVFRARVGQGGER